MAKQVISDATDRLQPPISELVNAVLITGDGSTTESDLRDKKLVFDIVYELHLISPQLLLYVIPAITQELHVDDSEVRLPAVHLLGDLYASSALCLGSSYSKQFSEFCERFHDVDADIRLHMVYAGGKILRTHSTLVPQIELHIKKRLLDQEKPVRLEAVKAVCDAAAVSLNLVSIDLLTSVGDRTNDKVADVRKEAATGLCQTFAAHIPEIWAHVLGKYDTSFSLKPSKRQQKQESGSEEESILDIRACIPLDGLEGKVARNAGIPEHKLGPLKKLCWIPSTILSMYSQPESEVRQRVLQLLDHILLPQRLSQEARARGIMQIYVSLDDTARAALKAIFRERYRNQKLVNAFLAARGQRSKSKETEETLKSCIDQLSMGQSKNAQSLKKLSSMKDQRIFHRMKTMSNPLSSSENLSSAKSDLLERVGSNSDVSELLRPLWRRTAMQTVTVDMIASLTRIVTRCIELAEKKSGEFDIYATEALGLVDDVTLFFPSLLRDRLQHLLDLLPSCHGPQLEVLMRVYGNLSELYRDSDLSEDLESSLEDIALLKRNLGEPSWCIKVAKHATRSLIMLTQSNGNKLDKLFQKCAALTPLTEAFEAQFAIDQQEHDTVESKSGSSSQSSRGSQKSQTQNDERPFVTLVSRLAILSELFLHYPVVAVEDLPSLLDKLENDLVCASLRQHSSKKAAAPTATVTLQALDGTTLECPRSSVWLDGGFLPCGIEGVTWSGAVRALASRSLGSLCRGIAKYFSSKKSQDNIDWPLSREETNDIFKRVVRILSTVCENNGQPTTGCELCSADSSLLKTVCSTSLVRIATATPFDAFCSGPKPLIGVGECLIDSSFEVRHTLSRLLVKLFGKGALKPIFLSWLAIAASDSNKEIKQSARTQLKNSIPKYRQLYSNLVKNKQGQDESIQPRLAQMSPDYSFPVLLFILSHLSNFPPESAWSKYAMDKDLATSAFRFQLCCLSELFGPLTSRPSSQKTSGSSPESLSFLMQMATVILNCEDAMSPQDKRIHACANLAQQILKNKLRRSDQVSTITPQVCLPTNIFKQRQRGHSAAPTPKSRQAQFEVNVGEIKSPPSRTYLQARQGDVVGVSQTQTKRSTRKARRKLITAQDLPGGSQTIDGESKEQQDAGNEGIETAQNEVKFSAAAASSHERGYELSTDSQDDNQGNDKRSKEQQDSSNEAVETAQKEVHSPQPEGRSASAASALPKRDFGFSTVSPVSSEDMEVPPQPTRKNSLEGKDHTSTRKRRHSLSGKENDPHPYDGNKTNNAKAKSDQSSGPDMESSGEVRPRRDRRKVQRLVDGL